MGKILTIASIFIISLFIWNTPEASNQNPSTKVNKPKLIKTYGKLSLSFEENRGQTDPNVKFLSRGKGYNLFLTPTEAVLSLVQSKPQNSTKQVLPHQAKRDQYRRAILRMRLVGANSNPQITGLNKLPGKVNYFIGTDPKKWRKNLPTFARVKYTGIYPGVDLVFYGNKRQLEYDFIVAPGADPEAINLKFEGADVLRINPRGNLHIHIAGSEVIQKAPVIYPPHIIRRKRTKGPGNLHNRMI
jgi:hypothetical protein